MLVLHSTWLFIATQQHQESAAAAAAAAMISSTYILHKFQTHPKELDAVFFDDRSSCLHKM
jgi:hypothetical protein